MVYSEIEFHPSVAKDMKELKVNPIQFSQINERIAIARKDLDAHTNKIRGMPSQFRKLKFADKRIVLWQSKGTLYVLKIFHRRQGYSRESLESLLSLIREYTA